MSQNDAYEPWYQVQGISYKEVHEALFNCLKHKLEDHKLLESVMKEEVKETTDFGSYRGYYTFLHTEYKNKIIERYNYRTVKK